jgi:tRNA-splicing ligase RtcB
MIRSLSTKASAQIGTSGGGNHFVDIGLIELYESNPFGVLPGKYVGILSHSGSRGFGAALANHYTKVAMEKCVLPSQAKHLAWLDFDSQEGQEYWQAMTLAGDYASACHYDIHRRLVKTIGFDVLGKVENHHNYAWKETHGGEELIVHRKGATPAGKGVLGIIPGSMVSPAYIVMGKGNEESIHSASHGAGRLMSRTQAKNSFTRKMVKDILLQNDVILTGGDVDEAPMAYKNIKDVMRLQTDLVDVVGEFIPKLVRMAND